MPFMPSLRADRSTDTPSSLRHHNQSSVDKNRSFPLYQYAGTGAVMTETAIPDNSRQTQPVSGLIMQTHHSTRLIMIALQLKVRGIQNGRTQ